MSSYAAKIQKERKEREADKRIAEIEGGDRYTCAEKYELGTLVGSCGAEDRWEKAEQEEIGERENSYRTEANRILAQEEDDDKISLLGLLPKLPAYTGAPGAPEEVERFGPGMIETFTGDTYYFDDPDPTHIHLADIAHALSNHCRYAGHTKRFYSVGEHSILVRNILWAQGWHRHIQLQGLFHDAHEAYVMDAPRPLKPLLGPAFKAVAAKADAAIAQWISNHSEWTVYPEYFDSSIIKQADNMALVFERKQLMTAGPEKWERGYEDVKDLPPGVPNSVLGAVHPETIEERFIRIANELGVSE